ncbi:MAG: hypothetical protein AAF092_17220 [Pseudomonadota bacterium]
MGRLFFLAWILTALPAAAEQTTLPEGCTGFVTIQYKLCSVTHHYTCQGDPAGIQHRMDMDEDGPYFISTIDEEAQWVESYAVRSGELDRLMPDATDPMSYTDLAQTGRDDFDFSTISNFGNELRYRGYDRLTGETVVIDDVPLLRTENYARAMTPDGTVQWEARGNEYIHLDWRLFLGGQSVRQTPEGPIIRDNAPMEFHFPGDDGFLSDTPKFNCGALIL